MKCGPAAELRGRESAREQLSCDATPRQSAVVVGATRPSWPGGAHPKPPHVTLRNNSAPTLTNTSITTMADGDDAPEVCLTKVESARALVG